MIKVAIADDSPFICKLIAGYLEQDGGCTVTGVAHDAVSTHELLERTRPDVLTLDLGMPGGGLGLLRHLVQRFRLPIVVVSGVSRRAASITLQALDLGAFDFVLKYTPEAPVRPDSLRREIVAKVRAAAATRHTTEASPASAVVPATGARCETSCVPNGGVIVIGASTGGPLAVRTLLAQLPSDFALPCVIVQHLPATFTPVFASDLARHVRLAVREAASGDRIAPGCALIAPGASHLVVRSDGTVELLQPDHADVHRPSIDVAMTSVADVFGAAATGVVLTGMGTDGAEGLRAIRRVGGHAYVQQPDTCVVPSMPSCALERAGADAVAAPEGIGRLLAMRRVA
jgi:two-component system chemotaxis response regulator CheB